MIEISLNRTLINIVGSITLSDFKSDRIWMMNLLLDFESNSLIQFGTINYLSLQVDTVEGVGGDVEIETVEVSPKSLLVHAMHK